MGERLLLALDGSTDVCSAALLVAHASCSAGKRPADGPAHGKADQGHPFRVLDRRSERDGRAQAKVLLRLVDEMLEEAGRLPSDLEALVVGKGPGTFTGVRVTVATARALSLALTIPVAGVSTLGALVARIAVVSAGCSATTVPLPALSACLEGVELLVPVVDARRGQLFYAFYRATDRVVPPGSGRWIREDDHGVCDREALARLVGPAKTLIVGAEALCPETLPPSAVFLGCELAAEHLVIGQDLLDEPGGLPEGRRLATWLERATGGEAGTNRGGTVGSVGIHGDGLFGEAGMPESVTPIYVRTPDADVHITRMKDPWADGSTDG